MDHSRNWVFVGPTGAGKSSVAASLAVRRGLTFLDTDAMVERRSDRRIATIFAESGEKEFRRLESEALREARGQTGVVVATGAGIVLDPANRDLMRDAVVVYLHADVAMQLRRLESSVDRPLLGSSDRADVLAAMASQRSALYAEVADLWIDTTGLDVEAVVTAIETAVVPARSATAVQRLEVESPRGAYPIHIGAGVLQEAGPLAAALRGRHVLVVTDANVARLHLPSFDAQVRRARPDATIATCVMPAGESEKTLDRWREVIEALAAMGATRDAAVVALGGGVVGDLAGFAAASWMRGIDVVQVPTTLLAMVDSSVGGKTAVDLPAGKNLVGAFHPPAAVIADTTMLATLPPRELRAGLAEVVKYAAIFDAAFLDWLDAHADALLSCDPRAVAEAVLRSCHFKAEVVARDPFERGDRALLNFGHTFGHAIETEQGYAGDVGGLVHGEAVAVGMVLAARLSTALGLAPESDAARLETSLRRFDLPTRVPPGLSPEALLARMRLDKKADAAGLRFILWDGLGRGRIVRDVPDAAVLDVLRSIGC